MAGAAALVCAAPAARRAAVGGSGGGAVEVAHPASRAAYTGTAKSPGASAAGGFVEGTLDVDGRPIPWRLELPPGPGPFPLALILTHGSKGDLAGGELPTYAAAAAAASVPCLRFTCGSQSVATRARVMQALMLRGRELHPALAQAARWVVGGRSLGARTAAQLAFDCAAAGAAADSVDSGDANNATAGMARSGSSGSLSSEGGEGSGRDLACSIGAAGLTVAGALLSAYPVHPPNNPSDIRYEPIASLRVPLLVARGTKDPYSRPESWARLRARLADAAVVEVPGGDHWLHIEGDDKANAAAAAALGLALRQFLERLAGR